MLFKGYIDESYDNDFFVLSCTVSPGDCWGDFEREWQTCLTEKNAELRGQGRRELTRYHAADCQWGRKEFSGWSGEEQRVFTKRLLAAIKMAPSHSSAYTLVLSDVQDIYVERFGTKMSRDNLLTAAYTLTLPFCLHSLGSIIAPLNDEARITMFHDQSSHDEIILSAFNGYQRSPTAEHGHLFSTIASLNSRECLPLQAADFIAYEFFKDRKNEELKNGLKRRKSLAAFLEQGAGVILKTLTKETLNTILAINSNNGGPV